MAALFDSKAISHAAGGSIPSFDITIANAGSVGNIAVGVCAFLAQGTIDAISSVTVGGVTAALVTGTTSTTGSGVQSQWYVAALGNVSGAQAIVVTIAPGSFASGAVAIAATGVDQATSANNGTETHTPFSSGTSSLPITSVSGDLTVDCCLDSSLNAISAPNQTQQYLTGLVDWSVNNFLGSSTGPGTGSATHQWTIVGGDAVVHAGMNFKAGASVPTTLWAASVM
jgi:hypothetical protein